VSYIRWYMFYTELWWWWWNRLHRFLRVTSTSSPVQQFISNFPDPEILEHVCFIMYSSALRIEQVNDFAFGFDHA